MCAFEIQVRDPMPAFAIRLRSTVDEIPGLLAVALAEAWEAAEVSGLAPDGPPYTRYLSELDGAHGEIDYEAGVPLLEAATEGRGRAMPAELPGGTVAVAWHVGPYETLGRTYGALMGWIAAQGRTVAGPMWEVYWTDPDLEPAERWRTEVIVPVA